SEEIPRAVRNRLYLYKIALNSPNIRYMDDLLDFIQERFRLLPRQSSFGEIYLFPQFAAFVSAQEKSGGLHISLYGQQFRAVDLQRTKSRDWCEYMLRLTEQLPTAKSLIVEAYQHRQAANATGEWTFEDERKHIFVSLL